MKGFSAEPGERFANVPFTWPEMAVEWKSAEPTIARTDLSR
jgi:hypothetical protein